MTTITQRRNAIEAIAKAKEEQAIAHVRYPNQFPIFPKQYYCTSPDGLMWNVWFGRPNKLTHELFKHILIKRIKYNG